MDGQIVGYSIPERSVHISTKSHRLYGHLATTINSVGGDWREAIGTDSLKILHVCMLLLRCIIVASTHPTVLINLPFARRLKIGVLARLIRRIVE